MNKMLLAKEGCNLSPGIIEIKRFDDSEKFWLKYLKQLINGEDKSIISSSTESKTDFPDNIINIDEFDDSKKSWLKHLKQLINWQNTSSFLIYFLSFICATSVYLITENSLINKSMALKISIPLVVGMIVFCIFYTILKLFRINLRQKSKKHLKFYWAKNTTVVTFVFGLCAFEYGIHTQMLSHQSLPVQFIVPAATIFIFTFIRIAYSLYKLNNKSNSCNTQKKLNRISRNFCFFTIFAFIMGLCSAFSAYAFWNMLLGQVFGIIMAFMFLLANGFLFGYEYFFLISKEKRSNKLLETFGKIFNFLGAIGGLIGFNYEVFSLFGMTSQGPGFQCLSLTAQIAFVISIVMSITISIAFVFLKFLSLQNFVYYKDDLKKKLKDFNYIQRYKNCKYAPYNSIPFAMITFISTLFNCLAFSSAAFIEVVPSKNLSIVIWIYTISASLPGSFLFIRGYWNSAEGVYYKNIREYFINQYTNLRENDDHIAYEDLKVIQQLKIYYNTKLERKNKPFVFVYFFNFLEWLGISLQFSRLIYLVWSPDHSILQNQSFKLMIGVFVFVFFLFIISSILKFHNINLKNIEEVKELKSNIKNLDLLIDANKPAPYSNMI